MAEISDCSNVIKLAQLHSDQSSVVVSTHNWPTCQLNLHPKCSEDQHTLEHWFTVCPALSAACL